MKEFNEAAVVLCKCGKHHKTYGIRAEKNGRDDWTFTWAFPIKDSSAKREGYDRTVVKGNIAFTENYPGCPYCGAKGWVLCSSCGHLNCFDGTLNGDLFTCDWCGASGTIEKYDGDAIHAGIDL